MGYREDVKMIKALADENRLAVLESLKNGEKCACVLLEEMNITQPTLSHHMKILCDSGIVEGRKDGKWIYYSISQEGIEKVQNILNRSETNERVINKMNKSDKALELFSNNFNCSQAVLTACAPDFDLNEQLALKLGTSFGGARNGDICGAVSGALMVLGLKYGHYQSDNNEQKSRAYAIAVEYTKRFKELNGSIICRDLLGYDLTKPDEMACIKEKGLFGVVCPKMIKSAVEILESVLADYE